MTSSIQKLPLPTDDVSAIDGWDETVDDTEIANYARSSLRTSLTPHAMAHEHLVCGIRSDGSDQSSSDWLAWQTSLAPHKVCQVVSNASGNLVAATLDNGTISILRGTDGKVLATRRVAPEGCRSAATVDFVTKPTNQSGNHSGDPNESADTLIILPPEDGPPILVSNMQSGRLNNCEDPGIVAEAARSMGLHALRLEQCDDIRAIRGLALSDKEVRFALIDGNGNLAICDYNLHHKKAVLVERAIEFTHEKNLWELDMDVGLRIQVVCNRKYLVVSFFSQSTSKLGWFDLETLTMAGEYKLPGRASGNRRILIKALETLPSCKPSEALAVVLAVKYPSENPKLETLVVQAGVEETTNDLSVTSPHLLYSIPVPSTVKSIALASSSSHEAYSFRCKTWSGKGAFECYKFSVDTQEVSIGYVRLLASRNSFAEAEALLHEYPTAELEKDQFSSFHPVEISFHKLKKILRSGGLLATAPMNESQQCLQQLVQGALTKTSKGQKYFLHSLDTINSWPSKNGPETPPTIDEICVVLKGMYAASSQVIDAFRNEADFKKRIDFLESRLEAFDYMESIGSSAFDEQPEEIRAEFVNVSSIGDLFAVLVRNQGFLEAEKIWRSDLRHKVTSDYFVSSILQLSADIRPQRYANLLKETVFANLSIGHELLPPLLAWACRVADGFDEIRDTGEERLLDDAIFLLELAERSTKELRLRVHSSFARYTPFIETTGAKRRKVIASKVSNLDTSMQSTLSSSSAQDGDIERKASHHENDRVRPNPTILEIGQLQGGAQIARRSHSQRTFHAVDETEENVEFKLSCAKCLKHARAIGLDKDFVSLATFSQSGGADHVAKELIRIYSKRATSHEDRTEKLCGTVKNFCKEHGTNFDEALLSYAKNVCTGKAIQRQAIEECSSLARCCLNATSKCQLTLITLRAALFCRFSPTWLSQLSQEAIIWAAGNSSLRSELEEASRLLLIDGIVGRYCGEGAKELFHVDNPRHAIRLLQFVAGQLRSDSILADTLDLCNAFAHLSKEDACCRIFQNTVILGYNDIGTKLMDELFTRNKALAYSTLSRVIVFCMDLMEENSTGKVQGSKDDVNEIMDDGDFESALKCALSFIEVAMSKFQLGTNENFGGFSLVSLDELSFEALFSDLKRIDALRQEFSVRVSLSMLRSPKFAIAEVSRVLEPLVESYAFQAPNASSHCITQGKRMCSILAGASHMQDSAIWFAAIGAAACQLALKTKDQQCLKFMSDVGMLKTLEQDSTARSILAVSLSFCMKALKYTEQMSSVDSSMKYVAMSLWLLQGKAISHCSNNMLDKTMALTELCDVVTQVLLRTDEGFGDKLGAFHKNLQEPNGMTSDQKSNTDPRHSPQRGNPLHSNWYIGDGLLLPPDETLSRGLNYCKIALRSPSRSEAAIELHSFVDGRGAHWLGLRLLSVAIASRLSKTEGDTYYLDLEKSIQRTTLAMAERYVGGTGNGITSGVIDSQLAVACLLSLPLRMAFKVYRASLPLAISTRDFLRVRTLANIGVAAGSGTMFMMAGGEPLHNWKRQNKFVAQCRELALRANWWNVLEKYEVPFDPTRFQDQNPSSSVNTNTTTNYVASLIPDLLSKLASTEHDPDNVLRVLLSFADSFGIQASVPIQNFVELLLAPSCHNVDGDIRRENDKKKFGHLSVVVRSLLKRLPSPVDRALVLRKCLLRLETKTSGFDYERLSLVLGLYQEELSLSLQISSDIDRPTLTFRQYELELIDRRRDALAILSSFFQGSQDLKRPSFSEFFLPLTNVWNENCSNLSMETYRNLLGSESSGFDPLLPLNEILMSPTGPNAAAVLAPLCLPLGVPRGHIHVRSLIGRFKRSKMEGSAMPLFSSDVLPVLNRLRQADDKSTLAEWCAKQYTFLELDKLPCLDFALCEALKASNELESALNRGGKSNKAVEESLDTALERVKRINQSKDLLADRLTINAILETVGMTEQTAVLSDVIGDLMKRLEEEVWQKDCFNPEVFVEVFLRVSSQLAANATLCPSKALSIGQFRNLSELINRACIAVTEKYSHVQVGRIAKRLVRRWLFHGNQIEDAKSSTPNSWEVIDEAQSSHVAVHSSIMPDIDEEDTLNFVMDLNALQQTNAPWKEQVTTCTQGKFDAKLTSEEEPSSIRADGSARERSDIESSIASLRIAFIMALSQENEDNERGEYLNDENEIPNKKTKKTGSSRLLSKLSSRRNRPCYGTLLEHSKELLRIVFAKSVTADWIIRDPEMSIDNPALNDLTESQTKTITFSMRHRALRAAAVLCPQEVLEKVLDEEGLLSSPTSSLKKSSFAAFVSKEIEEMGLPLPHSDLGHLSTMHFPSYARTLWKHHRDDRGSKGRLLLLILEMYLKDSVTDFDFLMSIFNDMDSCGLPRTLLLAFDALQNHLSTLASADKNSFCDRVGASINRIVDRLSTKVFKEIKACLDTVNPKEENSSTDWLTTLVSLSNIVCAFARFEGGQENLGKLLSSFLKILQSKVIFDPKLATIANDALKNVESAEEHAKIVCEIKDELSHFTGLIETNSLPRN